jgi:hypothetical protein
VKVPGLEVRNALRIPKGKRNDASERRLVSVKRAKRTFDRLAYDEVPPRE